MVILSLCLSAAFATEPISAGVTVLTGFGATFDDDPATLKLQIQGELPIYPADGIGLGLVLPLELTTSGETSFGASFSNTMITFVPSIRVRVASASPVRAYADGGLGIAQITADSDYWLFQTTSQRTGWVTRFVVGIEAGSPDGGFAVVVEPIGIDTLHFQDYNSVGYTARIGVGARY